MATSATMAEQSIPAPAAPVPLTAATPAFRPAVIPARPAFRRGVIAGGVALVLAVAGGAYWLHSRQFEETDDAQIDGNISSVSPRTSGSISSVFVSENQLVNEGDPLAQIDPTDLQIA